MNLRQFSITLLLIVSTSIVFAQLNIGVKVSPGITPLRATSLSDTMTLQKEANPLRFLSTEQCPAGTLFRVVTGSVENRQGIIWSDTNAEEVNSEKDCQAD